jgi:putative nucleotidyltransferase-like protein
MTASEPLRPSGRTILPPSLPPEARLIVHCSRLHFDPAAAERTAELLQGPIDWAAVLRLALAQGVVPLVHRALTPLGPSRVPGSVLEELGRQTAAAATQNAALARELLRLLRLFAAHVRVISYKGPELVQGSYGDLGLRPFGDLDLLVHPRDVALAETLLEREGYERDRTYYLTFTWEYFFARPAGPGPRLGVDLHWRICPPHDPAPSAFDELWARSERIAVYGEPVPSLSAEDLLITLGIKFAVDCAGWKPRIVQLCDSAALIRRRPDLDWDAALGRARAAGGLRMLLLQLLMVNRLLNVALPQRVLDLIERDGTAQRLADRVSARLFLGEDFMPVPDPQSLDTGFYLSTRERLRDKAAYLRLVGAGLVRQLVRPSARDRAFVRLPASLDYLYYLVRPMRVLWQWRRTGRMSSVPAPRSQIDG